MSKKPVDYIGREIKEGDRVVYPVRSGSSMWLSDMVVEKVVELPGDATPPFKLSGTNIRGNRCVVQNLGRCVVIDAKKG